MNKDIMKKMGFEKQVERVEKRLCPFCQNAIRIEDFKDEISRVEYGISGLCQKCQDKIFGE
tara:strand:- start:138 stop:320 length:183 start_codon:yes stop_codon:yes gene_type:complete